MNRKAAARFVVASVIALQCFSSTVPAETGSRASATLLERLLVAKAPVADLSAEIDARRTRQEFTRRSPPADDAPIEALVAFWSRQSTPISAPIPSERTRERLLDALDGRLTQVDELAWYLPRTQQAFDRVNELAARIGEGTEWDARRWLRRNSGYDRDELVRSAALYLPGEGWYDRERDLRALCALDWEAARPIVARLGASSLRKSRALAQALTHEHAPDPKLHERLAALAIDPKASGYERDVAIGALASTDWPGRDAWLASLFSDASFKRLVDGNLKYSPLVDAVRADPDRLVPLVASLVAGRDRTAHDNAVECLAAVGREQFRADALRPLLPWLDDRDWSSAPGFGAFIAALGDVPIPESIPGLIRVVRRDDEWDRAYAAEALGATYHEARALPVLERALEDEMDSDYREPIVCGIAESGALPDSRIVEAIESYAEQSSTAEGVLSLEADSDEDEEPVDVPGAARLGEYLAHNLDDREAVAATLLLRAAGLRRNRPAVAFRLAEIVHGSWTRVALDDMAARLLAGDLDEELVVSALGRRRELRDHFGEGLARLASETDPEAGIAAVVLGDDAASRAVVSRGDDLSVMFCLAGARMTRTRLPVAAVAALLADPNPGVARAAEAYLLDEDSPVARRQLLARSNGTAQIVGNRLEPFLGDSRAAAFDEWESRLRAEVLAEGGPDEIFALLDSVIVRVHGSSAEVEILPFFLDRKPSRSRLLSADELLGLRRFVEERGVDDLPPVAQGTTSCFAPPGQSEYLHLTKDGGVRVFMSLNMFGPHEATAYAELEALFRGLGSR